jgi:hypothetical protein
MLISGLIRRKKFQIQFLDMENPKIDFPYSGSILSVTRLTHIYWDASLSKQIEI